MTKKIFRSILLVSITLLLSISTVIVLFLYNYFVNIQEERLRDELNIVSISTEESGIDYLKKIRVRDYRITWVENDGKVVYDSQVDVKKTTNHLDRVEIKEALKYGEGKSNRYSETLTEKTVYYARKLKDGSILRISTSTASIWLLVLDILPAIILIFIIMMTISLFLAKRVSMKITEPLNNINLEKPLENDTYEEISPLLTRINKQHKKINLQMLELERKKDEFSKIIDCMHEGLIFLDKEKNIISINNSAKNIMGINEECIGRNFIIFERDYEVNESIEEAVRLGHSKFLKSVSGRKYQIDISRLDFEDKIVGIVLLLFDITEREFAEKTRREFTANVSHELKTPLQSIIGSAELIENNMVKKEDLPRFIGYIRKESKHLLNLISDIIKLSQLDEGISLKKEEIDVFDLASLVVENLKSFADKKKVSIILNGEETKIMAVKSLIYDLIFNICDNAIKYNTQDGKVKITVKNDGKFIVIKIEDTGIGIEKEHLERIFERFYRVDKSHSKSSGGTGLGLSIVKHIVSYHNGEVKLDSTVGKGTSVILNLPKN